MKQPSDRRRSLLSVPLFVAGLTACSSNAAPTDASDVASDAALDSAADSGGGNDVQSTRDAMDSSTVMDTGTGVDSAMVPDVADVFDAGPAMDATDETSAEAGAEAGADVVTDVSHSGTVTAVVTRGDLPASGVTVIFNDAAGALITSAITDANGEASAVADPGAMITLVETSTAGNTTFTTITDVVPGDRIEFPLGGARGPTDPVASITVDFTAYPGEGTTFLHDGCGAYGLDPSATSIGFDIAQNCVDAAGNYSIMADAIDPNGSILAWSQIADLPPSMTTVTLPAWTPVTDPTTVEITGLTADPSYLYLRAENYYRGHVRLDQGINATSSAGSVSVVRGVPVAAGDGYFFDAEISSFGPGGLAYGYSFRKMIAPTTTTTGITWREDLTANPIATATGFTFDATTSSPPRVGAVITGSLTGADGLTSEIDYMAGTSSVGWRILLPVTHTDPVPLPVLPASLMTLAPDASTTIASQSFAVIDVVDSVDPTSFRTQRLLWDDRAIVSYGPPTTTPFATRASINATGSF